MSPCPWLTCALLLAGAGSSNAQGSVQSDQGWEAPRIVEHPLSAVVARGQPVTLNCRASGRPPPRISWLQDGRSVAGGRPDRLVLAPGSLFFLAVKERDGGVYWCKAESQAGEAISGNATLTVATLRDEFRKSPRSTKATRGDDAVLRCDPPRGHPEVTVRWLKNGDPLPLGNRLRMQRSDLYIADVQPADAGDYVCQASNVLGVRHSRPAALSVLVRPFFVLRPSPGVGLAGGSLLLPCRVGGSPRPRVHWRRLDAALPVGRLHYTEDDSMRIDDLRRSDAGQYSCGAENEAGRVSAAITVTVQVSPSVDAPARKAVTLGSQVALKCQVRGQPAPRVVWWKETEFDPLLADQERGRITTSVQNDLYISPVTSADLGWWICGATSAAGSVSSRVLLHTGARVKATPASADGRDGLDNDRVHLEEVKVTGANSVRLTWKASDRRPVDGFYICYIRQPAVDGGASPAAPVVRKVTVLNGGADSYELTGLHAGAGYQFFLVPFRGGREGRLSRLREVRLPEAAPSAAPGGLAVSFTDAGTIITWSPLPRAAANGRVTGYTVTVRRSGGRKPPSAATTPDVVSAGDAGDTFSVANDATDVRSAPSHTTERTYNVTSGRLTLLGRPAELAVRVAALTGAGRGPFSAWWRDRDPGRDRDRGVTGPPLTVTAAVPRETAAGPLDAWLVALLSCLGFFALGAGVLALHCHRIRRKQNVLAGNTPEFADTKPPPSTHNSQPDSLSQNTLWLRDELFNKNVYATAEHDDKGDRHVYVNGLSDHLGSAPLPPARVGPTVGLYASARVVGSLSSVDGPVSPRPAHHRSLGSARMARRLHSLGLQSARSAPGVSAAPHSQPASPRLRHDRHRAQQLPPYDSGSYQECCCYECDYGRGQPPSLPPGSPGEGRSDCDDQCSCEYRPSPAPRRRPRSHRSAASVSSAVDRGTQSSPLSLGDGTGGAGGAGGEEAHRRLAAPYAAGESSISDSSSSLYAETDLNEVVHLAGEVELAAARPVQRPAAGGGRQPTSRTHSLCSADSAYCTPGPSRHSFSTGDGGRPDRNFPGTPTDGRSGAKPGCRRRSSDSVEQAGYSAP